MDVQTDIGHVLKVLGCNKPNDLAARVNAFCASTFWFSNCSRCPIWLVVGNPAGGDLFKCGKACGTLLVAALLRVARAFVGLKLPAEIAGGDFVAFDKADDPLRSKFM
jgi:hypothetical protein